MNEEKIIVSKGELEKALYTLILTGGNRRAVVDLLDNVITTAKPYSGDELEWGPEKEAVTWDEAMEWCRSLGDGWRTPTRWEMLKGFEEGVGGFASGLYWSSSEYDSTYAWYQYFGNGDQYNDSKNYHRRVRAVRNKPGSTGWIDDRPPTEEEVPDERVAFVSMLDHNGEVYTTVLEGEAIRRRWDDEMWDHITGWIPIPDPCPAPEPEPEYLCPVCGTRMEPISTFVGPSEERRWVCPECRAGTGWRLTDAEALDDVRKLCS